MMNESKEYSISEFADINPKISLASGITYPFVEMKDLDANYKISKPSAFRPLTGGSRFENGDTLFARITPCLENGKICQVAGLNGGQGFGSTEFLVFRGRPGISDSDFVYYLCKTTTVRRFAEQHMVGTSGRQRVAKEAFDNLVLDLPPLPIQQRIAEILSSLDDKIELNRQMNQTLEEMAQAMFKHYFVNGIDKDNLPEGWRMGKLGDVFNIIMGQSPDGKSYNQSGNGMVFFQGRTDFTFRYPQVRMYTTEPSRMAKKFDTLVSVRAPVGDVNIANQECCIGRGIAAVQHKGNLPSFTYYSMLNLRNEFDKYEGEGTVFGSINKDNFNNIITLIPTLDILHQFEKGVGSLDELIYSNSKEIQYLTSLRDYLLPKLISGEIIPAELNQLEKAL